MPKCHHVVGRLAWQASSINPRAVHGYCAESMVGSLAEIYNQSASGPYHATIQKTAINKYKMGMRILWGAHM